MSCMDAIYFHDADELHAWLAEHHATADELLLGFYKRETGAPSPTYGEALDAALCYGWIDGVRRRVDEARYTIRFTRRTADSHWSAVNLRRAAELEAAGRLHPAGLAAYHGRKPERERQYSYENRPRELDEPYRAQFEANPAAWAFFQAQPPSYRRSAAWYVLDAKQEATRQRRLTQVIEASAAGQRLAQLSGNARK